MNLDTKQDGKTRIKIKITLGSRTGSVKNNEKPIILIQMDIK